MHRLPRWSDSSPVMSPAAFFPRPISLSRNDTFPPRRGARVYGGFQTRIPPGPLLPSTRLAKKAKTPPPPRRPVQAPQQRRSRANASPSAARSCYVLAFAALGLIMLGGVSAFARLRRERESAPPRAHPEDCVHEEQSYTGLPPAKHLQSPDAKVKYNSFPPSSGPHYQQPAPWGIYTDPVKQTILVHNLEHGGIVIQYGDVEQGRRRRAAVLLPGRSVRARRRALPEARQDKFALTAWNEPRVRPEPGRDFKDADPATATSSRARSSTRSALVEVPRRAPEQGRRALRRASRTWRRAP